MNRHLPMILNLSSPFIHLTLISPSKLSETDLFLDGCWCFFQTLNSSETEFILGGSNNNSLQ